MTSIYIKVPVSVRLPEESGYYLTDIGYRTYFAEINLWEDDGDPVFWMQQVELPTKEEIQQYIDKTPYYGYCTDELKEGIEQGILWVLDHIKKGGSNV